MIRAGSALEPERHARVLELSQAYLQYRIETGDIERSEMAPRALALLRARARIADVTARPAGRRTAGATRSGTSFRPAGRRHRHDRRSAVRGVGAALGLPRPARSRIGGYVPGAAIDFLDLHIRWYDSAVPELETATLMRGRVADTTRRAVPGAVVAGAFRLSIAGATGRRSRATWSSRLVAVPARPGRWASDARVYALADAAVLADQHWPERPAVRCRPFRRRCCGRRRRGGPSGRRGASMLIVEDGAREGFELSLQQGFTLARDLALRLTRIGEERRRQDLRRVVDTAVVVVLKVLWRLPGLAIACWRCRCCFSPVPAPACSSSRCASTC